MVKKASWKEGVVEKNIIRGTNPVIIAVASTGGKWRREDSPWVPMTPEEIVNDVVESFYAGASMAHVHARDENGQPTHDPKIFARIINPIRTKCRNIIIQISTGYMEGEVKFRLVPLLELKPDMASFNLKGSDDEIVLSARLMDQYKVKPVVECFSIDMLNSSKKLIEEGILQEPVFYEFVFSLEDNGILFLDVLEDIISRAMHLPKGSTWSQTRGANHQRGLQAVSICLGGHVRTGLEDNLYLRQGTKAKKSSELISQVATLVEVLERRVASPEESRTIIGLYK